MILGNFLSSTICSKFNPLECLEFTVAIKLLTVPKSQVIGKKAQQIHIKLSNTFPHLQAHLANGGSHIHI